MILINVRYNVRPEFVDTFLEEIAWFTEATRAEEGNIFFEWYQDPHNPAQFLLIESFHDDADVAHVQSEHFQRACKELPRYFVETPKVINTTIPGKTEWDKLVEFAVEG
ncbi:antibiotic biosynthesis monooxygenase [Corynebacterium sp. sy017]|uniref:putative quinol monooxygenase n=1 Tax=unclassified Corynebacterium TaxID=2624378 RepID=UPI001186A915|nr:MULTISPECIES: putative quinol monooxygenase [unclassified Corynebacterium]MBP3088872.1 antibiotic biosynthesis monooxygenase [Corynebacterium sp. sy017]QDZ42262.1 antibiotic biosynthesis monooxygenase [Corynebacterium sp. sy039]TSD91212.1 antibiotic biosynthesis monooxygenase [Corynebacterium sp. SY003]